MAYAVTQILRLRVVREGGALPSLRRESTCEHR